MAKVKFEHTWSSPFSIEETWALFCGAFIDSDLSAIWPDTLSKVKLLSDNLQKDAVIAVDYRMGAVSNQATYVITDFNEPNRLAYKTTANHPLVGASTIDIEQTSVGVKIHWSGVYESKGDLKGLALLAWFKIFYENFFFPLLKRAFRPIRRRPLATYKDLSHTMH